MEYSNLRNKIGKFYIGGKIQKLQLGGPFDNDDQNEEYNYLIQQGYTPQQAADQIKRDQMLDVKDFQSNSVFADMTHHGFSAETATATADNSNLASTYANSNNIIADSTGRTLNQQNNLMQSTSTTNTISSPQLSGTNGASPGLSTKGKMALGIAAKASVGAINMIDNVMMGDKNFDSQSQAVDSAVHGVSGALMSSGNPYAMVAGAALEGVNFMSKAGGRTVQGFDVNIESSGYGTLGHMESKSYRDWGALIGLGGIFNKGAMQRRLERRNEQARLAMTAAAISDDVKFEQEARMNSVDNVLRNNQIALAGGIDTNQLGA